MTNNIKSSFKVEGIHYGTGNPVRIAVDNGCIGNIVELSELKDERNNLFLAPALIDNQVNGYAGVDFSGENLSVEGFIKAGKSMYKDGVLSFLPTLTTNSNETLLRNFRILDEALIIDPKLSETVPGFHLEGPYISEEDGFRGCHPVKHIRKPSIKEFEGYQEAAGGRIIQVTLAPEVDGAMELISYCDRQGIVVAIGHTNANSTQISQAVENGARVSTHLGNGCANYIHRHNNPLWPQLANDMLIPSVIADGHHLLPEELRVFYKVKGPDNLILTSDIVYFAGMSSGEYTFMDSQVTLTPDGMLLNTKEKCLAGASFPLRKGVENMMNFTGCSLTRAIDMASKNVARIYGLSDRGELLTGKRADLIIFERIGNQLIIKETYLNGIKVYEKN